MPPTTISLRDASVPERQLELIRRSKFNAFDGEQVMKSLLRHRELWTAVLLDHPGVAKHTKPTHMLTAGLIKLRDLPDNIWNADTHFILTPTREAAEELASIAGEEDSGGEVQTHQDLEGTDRALGWVAKPTVLV